MKTLITILITGIAFTFLSSPSRWDVRVVEEQKELKRSKTITAEFKRDPLPYHLTLALGEVPDDQEWATISKYDNKHLIAHIYKHESSFGQHDVCRSQGGANGFGYNEWAGHSPTCYSSFEEVVVLVDQWIEDKKQRGFSLAEMSCYYIRGLKTESCNTSYRFL